jgi:hypothetical protein
VVHAPFRASGDAIGLAEQIAKYDTLRGYSDGAVTPAGHHPMRH